MVKQRLAPMLAQHHDALQVVRQAAEDAEREQRALHPVLVASRRGPYSSTRWLHNAAIALPEDGRVLVGRLSDTENVLEIRFDDQTIHCSMFYAEREPGGRYSIHLKGHQTKNRPSQNLQLPGMEDIVPEGAEQFWYALRVRDGETGNCELHVVLGANVQGGSQLRHIIEVYDGYIVKPENDYELVDAFEPQFTPVPAGD